MIDVSQTLTLQIDNTTFAENAGAGAATGTVTLSGPTALALTVTLSSSDTASAEFVPVDQATGHRFRPSRFRR